MGFSLRFNTGRVISYVARKDKRAQLITGSYSCHNKNWERKCDCPNRTFVLLKRRRPPLRKGELALIGVAEWPFRLGFADCGTERLFRIGFADYGTELPFRLGFANCGTERPFRVCNTDVITECLERNILAGYVAREKKFQSGQNLQPECCC